MLYKLLLHPAGHIAAYNVGVLAPTSRFAIVSYWNDVARRNMGVLTNPTEKFVQESVAQLERDGFAHVCKHEVLDEEPTAIQNALHAIFEAFDTHRDPTTRHPVRWVGPFRITLDALLKAHDRNHPVPPVVAPEQPPLPTIALLRGVIGASRYDFWELC